MGSIPIVSKESVHRRCRASYLDDGLLPSYYMGDFSMVGLLVDKLPKTLRVLEKNGIRVAKKACGYEAATDAQFRIGEIVKLLRDHGIDCGMSDLVTQVYQG